nr:hypothetical protein [Tanacetum cinerariifolium]
MDDEPMWAVDGVVALTPGSAITIPETTNEFSIKDTENEVVCLMMFPLSLTGEAKIDWTNSMKELSKHKMKFEPLLLANSFPQLFSIDSSEKSEPSPNMK